MGAFWDERARENAAYFVDNRLDYGEPDLERLWASGPQVLDAMLGSLGVALRADDDVVELGCGLGRLTRVIAARARSVRALDVSAEMLRRAAQLNPELRGVRWIRCDGRSLTGVADASADAFLCHVVFQHVPDPSITYGYVGEVGRVLRRGGWAALQVSDDRAVHRRPSRGRMVARKLRAAARRGPGGANHPAWLGSAVDLAALRAAAERAGLTCERIEGEGTQFCLVLLRRS